MEAAWSPRPRLWTLTKTLKWRIECGGKNFGPKILILLGGSKSCGAHVTEKPPRHLVRIVFRSGMGPNGPKMPIFGKKYQFLTKFGRLRAKNPNFFGTKKKFWYPYNRKTTWASCPHCFWVGHWIKWAKNYGIWPKMSVLGQIWPFLGQKSIFWGERSKTFVILIPGNQWESFFSRDPQKWLRNMCTTPKSIGSD